jgi:uncharacterized protein (DUF433 family)
MSSRSTVLNGVVHGKTIELEQEPGLPDGQVVQIEIRPVNPTAGWLARIVLDPAVQRGQPVIKGTQIPAEDVVRLLDEGRTEEEVRKTYPVLTQEDIAAVRQYGSIPLGLRRSFGAWAEDEKELDQYLEWNRAQRKIGRREVEA